MLIKKSREKPSPIATHTFHKQTLQFQSAIRKTDNSMQIANDEC